MIRSTTHAAAALCIFALAVGQAHAADPFLKNLETTFVELGEKTRQFVVNINVTAHRESPMGANPEMQDELFRFFGITPPPNGGPSSPHSLPSRSQGSGFIFDARGYILTNAHVVAEADVDGIVVELSDGSEYRAKKVGFDEQTDVAVIKIEADGDLPFAKLGDSSTIKPGQFAIAIGSPQGLQGSLSFGHVTGLGRDRLNLPSELRFQRFIQTDAAINLGNSGGPLCNIDGEVIGINTAIAFGANSLGFAIPINTAKGILDDLIEQGQVIRGYLGVEIKDAALFVESDGLPDRLGAYVVNVRENTPAERAGVQRYDVIREINGTTIDSSSHLTWVIAAHDPGETVAVEVLRNGRLVTLDVNLETFDQGVLTVARSPEINPLGIRVDEITDEFSRMYGIKAGAKGVVITTLEMEGAALESGLRQGDVIMEIARQEVGSVRDYNALLKEHAEPGSSFTMLISRRSVGTMVVAIKIPGAKN
jgi:serine protease Do